MDRICKPPPIVESSRPNDKSVPTTCTGAPTLSNFEYAGWLTEANHLGNVAYRAGKKLQWDPVLLSAANAPEADPFIRRQYRKGWSLS